MTTEDERAREYRRKMQAREDFKLQQELAMKGDSEARRKLAQDYSALYLAHVELDGWEPVRKVEGDEK